MLILLDTKILDSRDLGAIQYIAISKASADKIKYIFFLE